MLHSLELLKFDVLSCYWGLKRWHVCVWLCDPIHCSLPGSSVCGILQARILEWVAVLSSRGSSQPRDQTPVSCIAGGFFTAEPWGKPHIYRLSVKLFSRAYWAISSPQTLPSSLFPEAMTSKCLAIYFVFTVTFPGSMVISLFFFSV